MALTCTAGWLVWIYCCCWHTSVPRRSFNGSKGTSGSLWGLLIPTHALQRKSATYVLDMCVYGQMCDECRILICPHLPSTPFTAETAEVCNVVQAHEWLRVNIDNSLSCLCRIGQETHNHLYMRTSIPTLRLYLQFTHSRTHCQRLDRSADPSLGIFSSSCCLRNLFPVLRANMQWWIEVKSCHWYLSLKVHRQALFAKWLVLVD